MDYVNKKHEIGQLTQEQLLAHLIRLQESSSIVTEFAAARAEKPKADKQRITAKDLYGKKGSATGPESRRILAVRHADTQAEKEGKAARNEERYQAKALKVAREVTKGGELLKAIELFGNPKLKSLTLPDLQALLTNADPQGNETKPKNKTEALLRVTALSSVQAALSRRALAVAAGVDQCPLPDAPSTATAAAPAILTPQQHFLPSEEDIVGFRLSYGSFASSGAVELPLDHVGSDAP
jgi:hypothetical protein